MTSLEMRYFTLQAKFYQVGHEIRDDIIRDDILYFTKLQVGHEIRDDIIRDEILYFTTQVLSDRV
jgi:hypothetical protein